MIGSKTTLPTLSCVALLLLGGCGGNAGIPMNRQISGAALPVSRSESPADTTSILKKLTNDVLIGSTIDPTNGDTGPRALSGVPVNYGLKKGQLLVCNFADSSGSPGQGTTIDVFDPKPSTNASTFVKNSKILGCDGVAASFGNQVYAAGQTSKVVAWFNQKGTYKKSYGSPIQMPLADADLHNPNAYSTEYLFVGDLKTGGIINFAIGGYGNPKPLEVIGGFAVSGSGWSALGPGGIHYDKKKDVLYIVDGVDNTVVSVSHPGNLLVQDEIVVKPGGKTFTCLHKNVTCAKLIYAGKPLNEPVATALLPNGNLIVANGKGGNTLVELTPAGQILATKVVDKSKTQGIFALLAVGSSDSNTALYYTDTNSNELRELTQ